jgi:2-oxoglutarate ferredoxin oxidoreductase subunit delta
VAARGESAGVRSRECLDEGGRFSVPKGIVTIDHDRCKRCGICVAICPPKNLEFHDGRLCSLDRCTGCGLCELHCPDFAIVAERIRETAETAAASGKG